MSSALDAYAATAANMSTSEPTAVVLSNADGEPVASASDAMTKLVAQMTRPVRWDLCTEALRQRNVTAIVEFPPAGTLTGIAKRELRGIATHAVKSPADLDGLTEL
jgi:[acyl-carrier-protein] S-malonyltransferase